MNTTDGPVRQDEIIWRLKEQILRGSLKPGQRLPTRSDLHKALGASSVTLQRAFDRLVAEGFVVPRGKRGTFVADHPPHLGRYAVAMAVPRSMVFRNLFYSTISSVAAALSAELPLDLPVFTSIDASERSEGSRTLLQAVEAMALAGLIFVGRPEVPDNSPLITTEALPRVTLNHYSEQVPHFVDLGGAEGFAKKAVKHLAERGRRRLALIVTGGNEPERIQAFEQAVLKNSAETHRYWIHAVHPEHAVWADNLVHLIYRDRRESVPDGLVIADDNLVEHACAGLIQAGMRVPEEVEVVAHCNFPYSGSGVLPVTRLGYDIRATLLKAVDVLDRQRRAQDGPTKVTIPPVFEWELPEEHRTF